MIDKSAAAGIWRPGPQIEWADPLERGRVAICAATEFAILFSARSAGEYHEVKSHLRDVYGWAVVPDDAWQRIFVVQEAMAMEGHHRSASAVDLLVAVTAQAHDLTVLHYDHDFETISRYTELKSRWLAEPGTLD